MVVRRRTVLLGAASVPLVAACGASPGEGARPLKLEKTWQEPLVTPGEAMPGRARIVGDSVVLADGSGTGKVRLVCFGAADGVRRWTLDGSKPLTLPGIGNGWLSIVGPAQYFSPITIQNPGLQLVGNVIPISYATAQKGATTSGIIGVDARTGAPAWRFSAAPTATTDRTMVTAVAASVVLATVSAPYGPHWPATSPTTIAIDAKTGTELWRATGLTGLSGDGESVVVARRTGNSAAWLPEVLDARTGKARWTGANALGGPYGHKQTASDFVLLSPGNRQDYELVRLSTGDQLDVPETSATPVLVGTEPPLLAWDSGMAWWAKGPNGFVTQTLPKGRAAKGKHRPGSLTFRPALGIGPYLWGELQTKQGSKKEDAKFIGTVAVDRTGALCSPPMRDGAAIADVSDQWLLLGLKDHLAVHRIHPT
ncbi:PQQ-binding-like beta-propeller repeat protein [Kribbella sp. NPDC006257]|uniref:outer membrane protein assembly factor BamB family protein n=1 Tax=Kribbella sp. NPDC006257 TaxID=3156738 RepID=UPI0033B26D22